MEHLFRNLGFSAAEQNVYLLLIETSRLRAGAIAKRCKLPRSTVYSALDALLRRGLITEETAEGSTLFAAAPPAALEQMASADRALQLKTIDERTRSAQELMEIISGQFKSDRSRAPRFQLFEGRKQVDAMLYANEELWQESVMRFDGVWWGYQDTQFVEQYSGWLNHYWFTKLLPTEEVKLLSNESEIENKLEGTVPRRTIKRLPRGKEFSSTIWALGDYVVSIMTRESPHYAVMVKDPLFAANQRSVFQLLWPLL